MKQKNKQTGTNTDKVAFLQNKINFSLESDAFSFEDFITGSFSAKTFNGSWWSANQLQWSDKVGPILYNPIVDTNSVLVVSTSNIDYFINSVKALTVWLYILQYEMPENI